MKDKRSFIKVHDGISDHPKIAALSDASFRLLLDSWCWSSRHLTDGVMPRGVWDKRGTAKGRQQLVAAGLVIVDDAQVVFHDYLVHQSSAAERADAKTKAQASGKLGGQAKARNSLANASPVASPVLGDRFSTLVDDRSSVSLPELELERERERTTPPSPSVMAPPRRRTRCPEVFEATDDLRSWLHANCPAVNGMAETENWLDWHRAKGDTAADWIASWKVWMRRAQKDTRPTRSNGQRTTSTTDDRVQQALSIAEKFRGIEHREISA